MRIDDIQVLTAKCTGCMACVDACPKKCISQVVGKDGFLYSTIDDSACVRCGKCYAVCPIETQRKHDGDQHLYAAYSTENGGQMRGSSGGIFELLAMECLDKGYYVCGAAFEGTTLAHRIVKSKEDLIPLLKSKYLQSDMQGIYAQIRSILKQGEKVLFCGTPCQVSALVNSVDASMQENLLTADIICHGVPSQSVFDMYIRSLEKKHGGKVSEFSFRVKNNRYKHAHGYSYTVEKNGKRRTVNGIYTNSSFYNAFKNYTIFREGCYDCRYATLKRVSDITLGDFWGIEKYDFRGNTDTGVSMIITHTEKGKAAFDAIAPKTVVKEFPVQYGVDSNHCLTKQTAKPKKRDEIIKDIADSGYEAAAKKYFKCGLVHKIYWMVPPFARNMIRKIRGS